MKPAPAPVLREKPAKPKTKRKLEYHDQHLPGYGGPPQWHVRVVYANRVLAHEIAGSEYGHGVADTKLKAKWGAMSKRELDEIAATCPLAGGWCYHCGNEVFGSPRSSSMGGMSFCGDCHEVVSLYQARENERATTKQVEWRARQNKKDRAIWSKQLAEVEGQLASLTPKKAMVIAKDALEKSIGQLREILASIDKREKEGQ